MEYQVYLAGPITGMSYDESADWRRQANDLVSRFNITEHKITLLSPLRHKDHLFEETKLLDTYDHILSTQRGIYGRDKFDCTRADALLVNLLGAERVSIGTVMEIAWAAGLNKPIILIMEPKGNIHDHAMLREASYWRTETLEQGCETLVKLLVP